MRCRPWISTRDGETIDSPSVRPVMNSVSHLGVPTMGTTDSAFYVTGGTLRADAPVTSNGMPSRVARQPASGGILLRADFPANGQIVVDGAHGPKAPGAGHSRGGLDLTSIGQKSDARAMVRRFADSLGSSNTPGERNRRFLVGPRNAGSLPAIHYRDSGDHLAEIAGGRTGRSSERGQDSHGCRGSSGARDFRGQVDVVRSLAFSTDEFFAAIRECHTRRPEDPV